MKITKIRKKHFEGNVYNFHCTPNENYFANGILVHNCYKGNGKGSHETKNMSLDTFKEIFHKMGKQLTQIAFGIMDMDTNPDFLKMIKYSYDNNVIPNFTMHGLDTITVEQAEYIQKYVGAIAVSMVSAEKTYDMIKFLSQDLGKEQINIHYMLANETYDRAFKVIDDIKKDPRLSKLNAIVFLSLKQKGRGEGFTPLSQEKFTKLISYAKEKEVGIGFDSCSAHKYMKTIKTEEEKKKADMYCEPCESFLESFYCNYEGVAFPCSFMEDLEEGRSILDVDNVLDLWRSNWGKKWRNKLLSCNRNCPEYKI